MMKANIPMKTIVCATFVWLFAFPPSSYAGKPATNSAKTSQQHLNNQEFMTYGELIDSLKLSINALKSSDTIRHEFQELQKTHGISGSDKVYDEFVIVRTIFEATRDSGLWQIRWAVTDQEPNSDLIWAQWNNQTKPQSSKDNHLEPTATAECDELSALFALIARDLGVDHVGLFWPTWNHTVAVWITKNSKGKAVRIVIPTSQIYLSANATLGTKEFDPYKQKTIYKYRRKDISKNHKIPMELAKMMLSQIEQYGAQSSSELQKRRNKLSKGWWLLEIKSNLTNDPKKSK